FFFSSRRRHTRSKRDWSSDVCSSDLFHADNAYFYPVVRILSRRMRTHTVSNTASRGFGGPQGMLFAERMMDHIAYATGKDPLDRSEERRVGKEGRGRWGSVGGRTVRH